MGAHPFDGVAHEDVAERVERQLRKMMVLRHAGLHDLAVASGQTQQCIEVGVLAFEPAVEGADGHVDLSAERLDRQFLKPMGAKHLGARMQQRGGGLAASLLP